MNRRVTVTVLLAAVLSVVAVPVAAVFALGINDHSASGAGAIIGVSGFAVALFATAIYWRADSPERKKAQTEHEGASLIVEGPIEIRLLHELAAIEEEAQVLLGEGKYTTVIRLRSRLQETGVWSESDVYDFDVALRIRNEVAHGDQKELTRASLTKAVATLQRLRERVEASRPLPPVGPTSDA